MGLANEALLEGGLSPFADLEVPLAHLSDDKTPIVGLDDEYLELQIENLGDVPLRTLRWELPLAYPEMPARRLPTESEVAERKAAERAERKARAEAAQTK